MIRLNKMIKSVAIEKSNKAFLPEAYAYRDYFRSNGLVCEIIEKGSKDALEFDAVLLFHGFHPFWKKYPSFVIGDYNSLSTGRFNKVKDIIKRIINVRSDLNVFLNEDVRRNMFFSKKNNYITRGMGYFEEDNYNIFNKKKFDIIYCGSFRPGILKEVYRLADLGFSIALVGMDDKPQHRNIKNFGKVVPAEARELISQAKYGLNYTPDIFPLNIQDSTKVIEYCAAGLGVISNRYKWINDFENNTGGKFITLKEIEKYEDLEFFDFIVPNIDNLSWESILKNSDIINKLN